MFILHASMVEVLLDNIGEKPYHDFLKWLVEMNFYKALKEKKTIKGVATDFKGDTIQITKWFHEIYTDILDLNYDRAEIFKAEVSPGKLFAGLPIRT